MYDIVRRKNQNTGHGLGQGSHCGESFTKLRSHGASKRKEEKWWGGRGSKGDTEEIRGSAFHLARLLFAALVCKPPPPPPPPGQLPGQPEKTGAGDNRRLGAFSSKCKLSHLSAINQEVYGDVMFALELKNHKASTLSGCGKRNSRTSTAEAVNQLLLLRGGPALRWGISSATDGK